MRSAEEVAPTVPPTSAIKASGCAGGAREEGGAVPLHSSAVEVYKHPDEMVADAPGRGCRGREGRTLQIARNVAELVRVKVLALSASWPSVDDGSTAGAWCAGCAGSSTEELGSLRAPSEERRDWVPSEHARDVGFDEFSVSLSCAVFVESLDATRDSALIEGVFWGLRSERGELFGSEPRPGQRGASFAAICTRQRSERWGLISDC